MTTENADIDTIASAPTDLTLVSGTKVQVERLKTRQLMRLMKILTRGAGPALSDLSFEDGAELAGQVLATVAFSIPEAEEETIEFVQSMVSPVGLIDNPRSGPEHEVNIGLIEALEAEMRNPELEDLISVLERVITVEAPHLVALGKRLALLLKVAKQGEDAKAKTAAVKKQSASSRARSAN